jgi:hypothetical protein
MPLTWKWKVSFAFNVSLKNAVSEDLDFGIVRPVDAHICVCVQLSMEKSVPASRIRVVEANLTSATARSLSPA